MFCSGLKHANNVQHKEKTVGKSRYLLGGEGKEKTKKEKIEKDRKDQQTDGKTKKQYHFNLLIICTDEGVRKPQSVSKQTCYKSATSSLSLPSPMFESSRGLEKKAMVTFTYKY